MGFYGNMGQMWAIERNKLPIYGQYILGKEGCST